jgi:Polyketide cyclase / dehydrase and lipid transport
MTVGASAGEWELAYSAENLSVQRRDYAGSELDEIRGTVRVQATLNAVMALLKDADFNHEWVYRSGGARILQDTGFAQAYVYGVVDAPFPMTDRDTVVRFDFQQDPVTRTVTITITNFPEFIPVKVEFVRVPQFGGYWQLTPEKDGWVEVTYQVYGDPGGWIPVWVANRAALVSVQETLRNMIAVVGRYEGASSAFVKEIAE